MLRLYLIMNENDAFALCMRSNTLHKNSRHRCHRLVVDGGIAGDRFSPDGSRQMVANTSSAAAKCLRSLRLIQLLKFGVNLKRSGEFSGKFLAREGLGQEINPGPGHRF